MANPDTITLGGGEVRFEGLNEMSIVSTVEDPPKLRQAAPWPSLGLGCISFNRLGSDGKRQEEMILIQGKQDERYRGDKDNFTGEITIHIRNGRVEDADKAMIHVATLRHDGCWFLGLGAVTGGGDAPVPTPSPAPSPVEEHEEIDYVAKWGDQVREIYLFWLERLPDPIELRSDCENAEKYGIDAVNSNVRSRAGR